MIKNSKVVRRFIDSISGGTLTHPDDPDYMDTYIKTPYSALKHFDDGDEDISICVTSGKNSYLMTLSLHVAEKLLKPTIYDKAVSNVLHSSNNSKRECLKRGSVRSKNG